MTGLGIAAAGAALDLAGTGFQYLAQRGLNEQQNVFSATEAQKQRDFEARMSSTSYSRAVKDMKNAGLNPALMYGSAAQASTPAGAAAQSSGSGQSMKSNAGAVFTQAFSAAAQTGAQIYAAGLRHEDYRYALDRGHR